MSSAPEPLDSFDDVFEEGVDKKLVIYLSNGKAMEGILRSFDSKSIRMDSARGLKGGTAVRRDVITAATLA